MAFLKTLVLFSMIVAPVLVTAQSASDPSDGDLQKGTNALRSGQFEEAQKWLTEAVKLSPENPVARMELGVANMRLGQGTDAIEQLNRAIAIAPNLPGAHLFLGIAYVQMRRVNEAVAALHQAAELDPNNAQLYMWEGVAQIQDGHPEKATAPLDRAAELAPNDLNILEYRGKAHSAVAYASYARMAVIDPESWHVHRVQAQMYAQQGLHKEAVAEFLEALKLVPGNSDLYEELGAEYRKSGQLELSQQAYSRELELSPNNPVAMYNLAKIDIETNRTPEGMALLHKVADAYANVPATYFYLGLGELDQGHVKDALTNLEKARDMQPEPELMQRIQYELSRVYRKLGRLDDSNRAIHEYARLKAQNAKLNPAVLSAISTGFSTADVPQPKSDAKN